MEPITPERIIPFATTRDDVKNTLTEMLIVNHARSEQGVDDKLLYSIINKQPKRADHYWILNLTYVDTPNTLEYTCSQPIKGTLYSINLRIGFRIEPRVSLKKGF